MLFLFYYNVKEVYLHVTIFPKGIENHLQNAESLIISLTFVQSSRNGSRLINWKRKSGQPSHAYSHRITQKQFCPETKRRAGKYFTQLLSTMRVWCVAKIGDACLKLSSPSESEAHTPRALDSVQIQSRHVICKYFTMYASALLNTGRAIWVSRRFPWKASLCIDLRRLRRLQLWLGRPSSSWRTYAVPVTGIQFHIISIGTRYQTHGVHTDQDLLLRYFQLALYMYSSCEHLIKHT